MRKRWKKGVALCLSMALTFGNIGGSASIAAIQEGETEVSSEQAEDMSGDSAGRMRLGTSSNAEEEDFGDEEIGREAGFLTEASPSDAYKFTEAFSNTQGPDWFYKYQEKDSDSIKEYDKYDAGTPRWMAKTDNGTRIFNNGMMPGKSNDAVLEWVAPVDGVVELSDEAHIEMENKRTDRDGVLLSIQKNKKTVWPDQGTVSTDKCKEGLDFDSFYLEVEKGDKIHFRANNNKEINNDRVFWRPIITYQEELPQMICDIIMETSGSLTFTVENPELGGILESDSPENDITLKAIVNGGKFQDIDVTSAAVNGEDVSVEFDPIVSEETSTVQLLVGAGNDHKFITYSTNDFAETSDITYYVDAANGSDDNDGRSEEAAWKSLDKVNATTFLPGDSILFKAGGIWQGYLYPQGEGIEGAPITLGSYGGDGYPIISGNGEIPYDTKYAVPKDHVYSPTVLLSDQSYWVIDGLEVTNSADNNYNHVGILIFTTGRNGVTSNVTVENCYVHDVTAEVKNSKMTGGILAIGANAWIDGREPEEAMKDDIGFDEILIENNYVKNVAKEGIRSSGQSTASEGTGFRNTKTFTNVTLRGNYIEEIFGDGIVLAEVGENGLVENNVVKNHCNYDTANYAGAWLWQCDDSVFRYNEVFGGEYGYNDGEAFDYDIGCQNIVYEYNYSHHNKGGFLLTMYDNATYDFRYNISANDGKASQELFHCQTGKSRIYNNTMYIGKGVTTSIFQTGSVGFFKNNIILAHGNVPKFSQSPITAAKGAMTNNIIYPASILTNNGPGEAVLEENLLVNPRLSSPQAIADYDSSEYDLTYENMGQGDDFLTGLRKRMEIFKLQEGSPAINAGVAIADYAAAEDIFGNPITGLPDIGAHEFNNDPGPVEEDHTKVESVTLDKTEIYLAKGDTMTLKARIMPEDVLDDSVTWSSADETVATVNNVGKITSRGKGTTAITVKSNKTPEAAAVCTVHVYEKDETAFAADKDARVRDNGDASGTEESMTVKLDGSGYIRNVLMSFDVTGAPDEYERILLKFHVDNTDADNVPFEIYELGDNWEETTVKWSTMPQRGGKILDFTSSKSDSGTWKELDITDYVRNGLTEGKTRYSMVFAGVKSGSKNMINIHSKESDYKPQVIFDNETIKGVEDIQLVVPVGTAPVLPQTVKVTDTDGNTADATVVWDTIPADKYQAEGQFTVCGYIAGRKAPVVAYITVSDKVIESIEAVEVSTAAGVAPVLPETVTAVYNSGKTALVSVTWDVIDQSKYQKQGTFTVNGKVAGHEGGCQAKVTVTEALTVSIDQISVTGYTGFAPVLPDEVQAVCTDGSRKNISVTWDIITKEQYSTPGAFMLQGSPAGTELKAAVEITILSVETKPMAMESPQGKYPQLPRKVELSAGEITEAPVVWETVKKEQYEGTESYDVQGFVANTTISAVITVTPTSPIVYAEGEVTATDDTYIQVSPSDSNFGSKDGIMVKNCTYNNTYKRIGLVQFDVSGIDIEAASEMELKLYLNSRDAGGPEVSYVNIYATSDSWKESTATYDGVTQASGYKTGLAAEHVEVSNSQAGSYITIDVADAISYISDGKIAFAIDIEENPETDATGDHSGVVFASKEAGETKAPKLKISNQFITKMDEVSVRCEAGETPQLPEEITVLCADGSQLTVPVVWEKISRTLLEKGGRILVRGTAVGLSIDITAEVYVNEPEVPAHITELEPVAVSCDKGEAPVLPEKVKAVYSDGTKSDVEVVWDSYDEAQLMTPGTFQVMGTVEGTDCKALAAVTVNAKEEPEQPEEPEEPEQPPVPEESDDDESESFTTQEPYLSAGTWTAGEHGWKVRLQDGSYASDNWYFLEYGKTKEWYRFDKNGNMLTGWQQIDGAWYYFHPVSDGTKGRLYRGTVTPDGYRVNADGVWIS